ncbi:glutathione S-transferase N-terminal domain-containing protein [Ottowia sp. VDI28]|uniref:glutathione S-transferase N-terminal domain-containing protein n=1 Tax=Ottowia sp. VDI28 TaxID=3133968 RepID=UPI003C2F1DF3
MPATLYTFRRCPYAMRARWAILVAGVAVEQREVALRHKPAAMLEASPKGTVPVLVLPDGRVIDQSLDIMRWALAQHDPEHWLAPGQGTMDSMLMLIAACEREFKPHLDRYKYPSRYRGEWGTPDGEPTRQESAFSAEHFNKARQFLTQLGDRLAARAGLVGQAPALADIAIVPFVRQMARHERTRFEQAVPGSVLQWMDGLLARPDFQLVMQKQSEKQA